MPKYVVVHWLNDQKPGVCDIGDVMVADRQEGAITNVKFGSKRFPARVVLLTDDQQAAEHRCSQLERELAAELEDKVQSRRIPKAAPVKGKPASSKQVSAALEERCPVPAQQASKKRKIDQQKRQDKKNEREAEMALDEEGIGREGARRSLFSDKDEVSEDEIPEVLSNRASTSVQESPDTACHCSLLKKHRNAAVECFLTDIVKVLGVQLVERSAEGSSGDGLCQLQLKPLPCGVKAVDLAKHHGVLVTKAGLSRILLSGGSDPKALVRAALVELYGKEALMKMNGTRSLQKNVLDAIQAFVERNTTAEVREKVKWSWSTMTRIINQKSSGLRHKSKSPSAFGQKKREPGFSETSKLDNVTEEKEDDGSDSEEGKESRLLQSSTKKSSDTQVEARQPTPRKSPWKVTPIKPQPPADETRVESGPSSRNSNCSTSMYADHQTSSYPPPYHHPSYQQPPYYQQPYHQQPSYHQSHHQSFHPPYYPSPYQPSYQPYQEQSSQPYQPPRTPQKSTASLLEL